MSVIQRITLLIGLLGYLLSPVRLMGEEPRLGPPPGPGGPPGPGPEGHMGAPGFMHTLFPPELIMQHQREIGLRPEQRQAIQEAMLTTQGHLLDLQWQLQGGTEDLTRLLAGERIDEVAALAQADQVMRIEQQFKKEHLGLLIRVKNLLDTHQQAQLAQLRPIFPRGPHPAGGARFWGRGEPRPEGR